MTEPLRHIAVIDIGKTNAKLALVDRARMVELAVLTRPNTVLAGPPYPHFDTEGHWAFLLAGLAQFQVSHGVDAIAVTTHGACAALLAADGSLAVPVLDYEFDGPAATSAAYNALRPGFGVTGSPRLAMGLNLGAQLHWLFARDPGLIDHVQHVVTWPQYWGYRLTGVMACDVSSLGCHTDLWRPDAARFSDLVAKLGIGDKIAPPRRPDAVLGPLQPTLAKLTGIAPQTPVCCGIHDSNASLLPHLLTQKTPFSVVSTGTWVVCMAVGGTSPRLDETRDVLINVAANGQPVPSARFMGGRDYERVRAGRRAVAKPADEANVLEQGLMLRPDGVEEAGGPFPGLEIGWNTAPDGFGDGCQEVALAFYLAMMTAECLVLTGASGPVIVEGPFAGNAAYCRMLAAACGRPVRCATSQTGTSIGAALLFGPPEQVPPLVDARRPSNSKDYEVYAQAWRAGIAT